MYAALLSKTVSGDDGRPEDDDNFGPPVVCIVPYGCIPYIRAQSRTPYNRADETIHETEYKDDDGSFLISLTKGAQIQKNAFDPSMMADMSRSVFDSKKDADFPVILASKLSDNAESDHEGPTGNEGSPFTRWYKTCVLALVPTTALVHMPLTKVALRRHLDRLVDAVASGTSEDERLRQSVDLVGFEAVFHLAGSQTCSTLLRLHRHDPSASNRRLLVLAASRVPIADVLAMCNELGWAEDSLSYELLVSMLDATEIEKRWATLRLLADQVAPAIPSAWAMAMKQRVIEQTQAVLMTKEPSNDYPANQRWLLLKTLMDQVAPLEVPRPLIAELKESLFEQRSERVSEGISPALAVLSVLGTLAADLPRFAPLAMLDERRCTPFA